MLTENEEKTLTYRNPGALSTLYNNLVIPMPSLDEVKVALRALFDYSTVATPNCTENPQSPITENTDTVNDELSSTNLQECNRIRPTSTLSNVENNTRLVYVKIVSSDLHEQAKECYVNGHRSTDNDDVFQLVVLNSATYDIPVSYFPDDIGVKAIIGYSQITIDFQSLGYKELFKLHESLKERNAHKGLVWPEGNLTVNEEIVSKYKEDKVLVSLLDNNLVIPMPSFEEVKVALHALFDNHMLWSPNWTEKSKSPMFIYKHSQKKHTASCSATADMMGWNPDGWVPWENCNNLNDTLFIRERLFWFINNLYRGVIDPVNIITMLLITVGLLIERKQVLINIDEMITLLIRRKGLKSGTSSVCRFMPAIPCSLRWKSMANGSNHIGLVTKRFLQK